MYETALSASVAVQILLSGLAIALVWMARRAVPPRAWFALLVVSAVALAQGVVELLIAHGATGSYLEALHLFGLGLVGSISLALFALECLLHHERDTRQVGGTTPGPGPGGGIHGLASGPVSPRLPRAEGLVRSGDQRGTDPGLDRDQGSAGVLRAETRRDAGPTRPDPRGERPDTPGEHPGPGGGAGALAPKVGLLFLAALALSLVYAASQPTELRDSWTSELGTRRTLVTPREPGESRSELRDRHATILAKLKD